MDRQLLDDAIGTAPPSTVDVEAIIATQRRAARVRVVANPWVATAVALVAVVGGIWLVPGGDTAAPANTTSAVPDSGCPPESEYTRLFERVGAALPAGVDLVGQPHPKGAQPPPNAFCGQGFGVGANLTGSYGSGTLRVGVDEGVPRLCSAITDDIDYRLQDCAESTGPNGEVVVAVTGDLLSADTGEPRLRLFEVWVSRAGSQRALRLGCTSDSARAAPPLTTGQLTEIALDPGMTEYLG